MTIRISDVISIVVIIISFKMYLEIRKFKKIQKKIKRL